MEWVKPIDQVELEIRQKGVFLLADPVIGKLWFFGFKDQPTVNRMIDALRGRSVEMGKFLIARARAEGETT